MSQQAAATLRSRVPRIAGAAVERARLTVVPRTRAVRAARVPFVLLVSAILLTGVVGLLMFNTSMQQASFALDTYSDRAVSLAAREEQLTAELEDLRDPQSLADWAQRNGMVAPTCTPFLNTGTGKVTGESCPAVAGPPLPPGKDRPVLPAELAQRTTVIVVDESGAPVVDKPGADGKKSDKPKNQR